MNKSKLIDKAKNFSTKLSNAVTQIKDIIKADRSEGMLCKKEGMSCKKEGILKDKMTDYVCYRCRKYAHECQCNKKINIFNNICPYCKKDVKACICYMTDYHTYLWHNRYYDRVI